MKVFDQEFLDKHYLNCHLSTFVRNGKLHDGYHHSTKTVSLSREDVEAHNAGKTVIVIVGKYPLFEEYTSLMYLRPGIGKFSHLNQDFYPISVDMFCKFKLGDVLRVSNLPCFIKGYQKHSKRFVLNEREAKSNYLIGSVDGVHYLLDKTKMYGSEPGRKFRAYTSNNSTKRYEYAIDLSDCMPLVSSINSFSSKDIKILQEILSYLAPVVESYEQTRLKEYREEVAREYENKISEFKEGKITEKELKTFIQEKDGNITQS